MKRYIVMSKINYVINYIIENIDKNIWKPGDRISSEADLAKIMKVSRNTVREALSKLYNEGVIIKKVGSGSYVSEKYINKADKYIIIATQKSLLKNITGFTYRTVIDFLTKAIKESGYTPYVYIEQIDSDFTSIINIDPNRIAGVIDVFGNESNYIELLKKDIPIISCIRTTPTTQPTVCVSNLALSNTIKYLIDKYEFKKYIILAVEVEINRCITMENMLLHTFPEYLSNDLNNIIYVSLKDDAKDAAKLLEEKLLSLDYIPEAIIFTDDAIFTSASKCFKKFKHIFSETKVITQYTNSRNLNVDFNFCSLVFNLEEIAEKTIDLLFKLINKEYITYYNISIEPEIINEEVLQN